MVMLAPFISVLALLAAQPVAVAAPPTGAQPARAVILACNLPTRSVAGAPATGSGERIFRIAPGSFQEWNSTRREFGGNLCGAYTCVRTANKTGYIVEGKGRSYMTFQTFDDKRITGITLVDGKHHG